ncbi:MAG: hypothetical protein KIT57_05040 [Blastocatellales bacterium]|nr:hypothetical protein [Blastocatellales bacterium]
MMPTNDQPDQTSHAELLAMVKALILLVESLNTENQQLKAKIRRLQRLSANS